MPGDDDIPEYMRGVNQDEFSGQDNFTLRPDHEGPITNAPYKKNAGFDDYDDEEPAPPNGVTQVLLLLVGAVVIVTAVAVLVGASVAAYATVVRDSATAAEKSGEALVEVVIAQRNIVKELGARGGNRSELEKMLASVDSSSGLERSFHALAYTHAVQEQIVAIGDLRGTPVQRRQHELDLAQDAFEEGLAGWSSSAGNPFGQLAVSAGLANGPPAH